MSNPTRSQDGVPRQDADRRHPEVERDPSGGKLGLTSDAQPDLVAPSGVNKRDHGADDKPMGGGSVNLDDDSELRPRGNTSRTGGTWDAQGGDRGELGKAPGPGLSGTNGPSDPDAEKGADRRRS